MSPTGTSLCEPKRMRNYGWMKQQRAARITLSGDRSGEYVVIEERPDGSLVVAPDTSIEAIRERHNLRPATLKEFEAEYGPVLPPDGEG
jgi:hypothetical protein